MCQQKPTSFGLSNLNQKARLGTVHIRTCVYTLQYLRYLNLLGLVGSDGDLLVTAGDSEAQLLTPSPPSHPHRGEGEGGGARVAHAENLGQSDGIKHRASWREERRE